MRENARLIANEARHTYRSMHGTGLHVYCITRTESFFTVPDQSGQLTTAEEPDVSNVSLAGSAAEAPTVAENAPVLSAAISNESPAKPPRKRLRFLDTFRGYVCACIEQYEGEFCSLSIVIMIFVNYGGGGYSFFNHSLWTGLTIADLVFPWFMYIMYASTINQYSLPAHSRGTSMTLSFQSQRANNMSLASMLYKVIRRSVILWLLGMFIVNDPGRKKQHGHNPWMRRKSKQKHCTVNWPTLRIMGVLQRFAIAYLIIGLMRAFTHIHVEQIRARRERLIVRLPTLPPRIAHAGVLWIVSIAGRLYDRRVDVLARMAHYWYTGRCLVSCNIFTRSARLSKEVMSIYLHEIPASQRILGPWRHSIQQHLH